MTTATAGQTWRSLTDVSPWVLRDHLVRAILVAVGAVGLAVSWYGCAGETYFRDQYGWLAAGTASAAIASVGLTLWVQAGMRAVRGEEKRLLTAVILRRRLALDLPLGQDTAPRVARVRPTASSEPVIESPGVPALVSAPSMTRAHLPSCRFVRNKQVAPVTEAEVLVRGLAGCPVCRP
ncbi:hypothetical protein [Sporichthya sp.]|uniref:hypothetical protein n=1 Tax=Sporichthya sp. TaxID=65475 RepID=UPI0017DAE02D|nr:hypothetical protein [Sporichthya sp.]MBA3741359.1 hypothetical protein [Sporichthya sp.]